MSKGKALLLIGLLAMAAWAAAQSKDTRPPARKGAAATAGDAAKGKGVYRDYCGVCHFSSNTAKKVGPGLKGLYARGKFADGKKVDDGGLRAWIEKGGVDMPGFADVLSREQINELIAYMKTL